MHDAHSRRRAVVTAGVIAALTLPGSIIGAVALAGQASPPGVAEIVPAPDTDLTWTTDTDTTTVDPTTTDPTWPTTEPTSWPTTTDPTWPTTTDPTWTTTDPTWTTTVTTTTGPPPCEDPGPGPGPEQEPSDDPAVPSTGGTSINDDLIDVGTQILGLFRANGYPGFAGVIAEPASAVLRLYWLPGEALPPEIAAIVADPGAPIWVLREDAPYSRVQLDPLAEPLLTNAALSDAMCGFLHTIKVREEGTGLIAGVEPYDASFNVAQAESLLTAAAGVPVSVEVGPQSEPTGRLDDASPWFGGARVTSGPSQCSTAFGIVNAGTRVRHYMATALHCFAIGATVSNGDGTRVLGRVVNSRPEHDSELISVDAAGTDVYFGGVGGVGAAESNAPVRRAAANVRGTTVACTSGASTGENCSLTVVATNVREIRRIVQIGPFGRMIIRDVVVKWGMVDATSTVVRRNGQLAVAVGQGDSGGPVVTDSSRDRRALGVMSSGTNDVSCGLFAAPRKRCFSTVRYADINVLLETYVAELR